MIPAAEIVLKTEFFLWLFETIFPNVTYHALNAKRYLLQMPIVAIRIWGVVTLMMVSDDKYLQRGDTSIRTLIYQCSEYSGKNSEGV